MVGWCTEKERKQEFKDTEVVVQWRSINQGEIDNVWKKLSAGEVQSGGEQERSIQRKR